MLQSRIARILIAASMGSLLGCSSESSGSPTNTDAGQGADSTFVDDAAFATDAAADGTETAVDANAEAEASMPTDAVAEAIPKLLATISTAKGQIVVELDPSHAPITVDNFRKYADQSYYSGTLFHRVIKDFMIQGGMLLPDMTEKEGQLDPIKNEAKTSGLSNLRGTIAMARTSDPDSATSSFYINTVDNTSLDATDSEDGYCVFGKVLEGMTVVDAIESVPTHSVGIYDDVPVDDVVIDSVVVQQK
jgi:cyclophilin family peptidyl-prolyl cis-trans isomerase